MTELPRRHSVVRRTQHQPLIAVAVAAMAGTVVAYSSDLTLTTWQLLASGGLAWWVAATRTWRAGWGARLGFLGLLAAVAAMAGGWTYARWRLFPADELGLAAPDVTQPVAVEAILLTVPRTVQHHDPWAPGMSESSACRVSLRGVRERDHWRAASGVMRLSIRETCHRPWRAGDRIRVWGQLRRVPAPVNPGEFDRARYQRGQRELAQLLATSEEALELIRNAPLWSPRRWLEAFRLRAAGILRQQLEARWAPLAIALLLGEREQLDNDLLDPFLRTGMIHVLAISGMHLGLLVYGIWLAERVGLLRRRAATAAAAILVVAYAVLTGGQPPVVRAAWVVWSICLGRLLRRPADPWNLLAGAAVLVLALNPLALFQAGTQLSFLAVSALAWCTSLPWRKPASDPLERRVDRSLPAWRRFADHLLRTCCLAWVTSLVVWIVTAPLVTYRFHRFSPVAILLNPLLWLPVAGSLFSGFALIATGMLIPPLAPLLGFICNRCLGCMVAGIEWSERLLDLHVWLPGPPAWWVLLFYGGVGIWACRVPTRKWCWFATGVSISLAVLAVHTAVGSLLLKRSSRDVRLTMFAVGHGTCVLVELPGGRTLLYDAGRFGPPRALVDTVSNFLWSRGIRRLDVALISHADTDHFNALPGLSERFPIGCVLVNRATLSARTPLAVLLRSWLAGRGIPVQPVHAGADVPLPSKDVHLDIVHPPVELVPGSDNANSLVLRLRFGGRTILLPGDLEGEGFRQVLAQPPTPCDVAMAPHHGGAGSNTPAWADWCAARHVLISNSRVPGAETQRVYLDRGARIWTTATGGALRIDISRDGRLHIRAFRQQPW